MTTAVHNHNSWPHTSLRRPRCSIPHHGSCPREARSRGGCFVFGHTFVLPGVKLKSVYVQGSGLISPNTGVKEQNPCPQHHPASVSWRTSGFLTLLPRAPSDCGGGHLRREDIARAFLSPPYNVRKLIWIQQDLVGAFLGKPWVSMSQWQSVGSRVMGVR